MMSLLCQFFFGEYMCMQSINQLVHQLEAECDGDLMIYLMPDAHRWQTICPTTSHDTAHLAKHRTYIFVNSGNRQLNGLSNQNTILCFTYIWMSQYHMGEVSDEIFARYLTYAVGTTGCP